MGEKLNAELLNSCLSGDLARDMQSVKTIFHYPDNTDIIFREICCCDFTVCAVFIDGMINTSQLEDFILRAAQRVDGAPQRAGRIDFLLKNALQICQAQTETRLSKLTEGIMSGATVLLCQGAESAIIMDARGYETRNVNQANRESVVSGSQEGFVENLRTNLTLIRRYCQTENLVTEMLTVGTETPLRVAITYVKGVTDENALKEVRRRIKTIDKPVVHGLGQLEQLIEDNSYALVPQMLLTERPDRTAAALADGQFAVFADCSPYALIAPCSIFVLLQSSDDAFSRWQYGTYTRIVRFAGMLLALLLPGIYVALITYHTQLIPLSLLSSIAETRVNVPFPVLFEVFIMELAFFMINEANLRIPSQVGMSISIIGALVLGQAAVQASIISPMLIIIIALSGLGCYCMPDYGMTIALIIYRLTIEVSAAILGLFGVALAVFAILCQLCGMQSFGCDFVAPLAPYWPHNPDLLIRFPAFMQTKPMYFSEKDDGEGGKTGK